MERVAVYAALGCSTMHMSVWRGGLVDPGSRSWKYVILLKPRLQYFVYTYLHHNQELVEVSGETWQLVPAIHAEGDGLLLCE